MTPLVRMRASLPGEMLAEFFGTFIVLLIGNASVAVVVVGLAGSGRQEGPFGPANWIIVVFGWAFAVVFAVYVAGGISGAHLNPAVTLAFAVRRKFEWIKVIPFWLAQLAGAFCGAAVVYLVSKPAIDDFNAAHHLARPESPATYSIFATFPAPYFHGGHIGPLIVEIVGAAILVLVVAALTDQRNQAPAGNMAPLLIGFGIIAIGFSYGPHTGFAINPARDFAPRLLSYMLGWDKLAFSGDYGQMSQFWWIPIVGPLIGGVVGIGLYDLFIGQVLSARAAMMLPPEPGLAPEPTTATASGVAGPVTVEQDADTGDDRE
jgi:glycerol uptake facilitator protein